MGFLLEKAGYKLFNSAEAISNADSKILTQYKILNNNIPHPKTIISPLRYNNILDDIFYNKLIKELGLPMIIKEEFGSTGRQVYMAKNREELLKLENKLSNTSKLYQEYIKSNPSQSIRVYCIGGVIFGYVRFNNAKDFRSNTIGGGAEIFTPNKVLKNKIDKLCKKINKIFTLDYSGIDILLDKNNNPLFCEVNSNAGFQHFDKLYKESMASIYINYIIKRLKK
ncbi:MAG: ATP-grasp domain-containing protein [Cyanobium sp. MAG06]|nr:ATP-grasp domain-containing protein [Cyanobium sp. MAG06]